MVPTALPYAISLVFRLSLHARHPIQREMTENLPLRALLALHSPTSRKFVLFSDARPHDAPFFGPKTL